MVKIIIFCALILSSCSEKVATTVVNTIKTNGDVHVVKRKGSYDYTSKTKNQNREKEKTIKDTVEFLEQVKECIVVYMDEIIVLRIKPKKNYSVNELILLENIITQIVVSLEPNVVKVDLSFID